MRISFVGNLNYILLDYLTIYNSQDLQPDTLHILTSFSTLPLGSPINRLSLYPNTPFILALTLILPFTLILYFQLFNTQLMSDAQTTSPSLQTQSHPLPSLNQQAQQIQASLDQGNQSEDANHSGNPDQQKETSQLKQQEQVQQQQEENQERTDQKRLRGDQQIQRQSGDPISQSQNPIVSPLVSEQKNPTVCEAELKEQQVKETVKSSRRLAKFRQKQKQMTQKKSQEILPDLEIQVEGVVGRVETRPSQSKLIKHFDSQLRDIKQEDLNEHRMLQMMIEQKKRGNHLSLKEWDDRRVHEVSVHLNVVQGVQRSLDKAARTSFQNVEIYLSTFKSIFNQQLKSADYYGVDIADLTQNNRLSQNVYLTCSCILDALSEENLDRATRAKKLAEHINTQVLSSLLQPHIRKSQQSVNLIKTRISKQKSTIAALETEIDLKTQQLTNMFSSRVTSPEQHRGEDQNPCKDLFENQNQFLRLVDRLYRIHQQYARTTLQYYQIVKAMENQRIEVIRNSIKIYCQGLESIYQSQVGRQSLELLSKPEEPHIIQEFFEIQELLASKIQAIIRSKAGIKKEQRLTIDHLQSYFNQFKFYSLDIRQLVLKQYPVTSSVLQSQKLTLIITVDKYLHLFKAMQQSHPPILSEKINGFLGIKRTGRQIQLQRVAESKGGVLGILGWKNKGSEVRCIIQLQNKDKAQEVEDYLRKLI